MGEVTYALGDENTKQQAGDEEDDDQDDDDTGLTLGPVLALGQLGHGVLAASGDEVRDSGHCVGCGFLQRMSVGLSSNEWSVAMYRSKRWLEG